MPGLLTDAQKAWMVPIITRSMDVQVTIQRLPSTPVLDGYGHDVSAYSTVNAAAMVNVKKPSATTLQLYADIIGSKRALILRFMPTTDIRKGDQIFYLGRNWMVHGFDSAESYTFTDEVMITTLEA